MKRVLLFFVLATFVQCTWAQNNEVLINGQVTDGTYPLPNVNIKIINTNNGTKTDNSGNYSLNASIGDILEYSYVGFATINVIVEDVTSVLNLQMKMIAQELEEVVVKKKVRKSQNDLALEYFRNDNIIRTKFGYIDRDRASYTVRTYSGKDLPKGGDLLQALQMLYPQLRVARTDTGDISVFIRPNTSLTNSRGAIFDLDGQTLLDPPILGIEEIDRIAIIPSTSYSVRYGAVAAEGVIVINTKTGRIKPKTDAIEFEDLQAAQAAFIVDEFCTPSSEFLQSNELKKLFDSESESEAIEIFEEEKIILYNSPYLLIEAGNYFNTRWKNRTKTKEVWNAVKVKYADNPNVLKVIAYYFEQQNELKDALSVYQKISALRPEYAQTYRDLANIHNQMGNSDQAINIYSQYLKNHKSNSEKDSSDEIGLIFNVEALDILSKEKIKKSLDFQDFELPFKNSPTRIVLEWNNGETEFDVQMKREDSSSLIWNHSYLETPEQITQEKKLGYSMKQFFIDKDDKGKWIFTIKYIGNKSADPSYLKATIQHDYGTPAQKETVKVIQLPKRDSCLQIFSI
ncbi:MAG: carboxypeptidase-like regulatory domain-containing protein [Maribacter sp.]